MNVKEKKAVVEFCRARGAVDAKFIEARTVAVAEWVRFKCRFGCDGYNKCRCCPPHSPEPETTRRIVSEFSLGLLVHFGGNADVTGAIVRIERELFLRNHYKAIGFGAGPCRLCETCPDGECAHPDKARPSMEACGIDVYMTARDNGFPIDVLTSYGDAENCYGLVLVE